MILKDPADNSIHCLRVIHLYEAEYNLLVAVKWRETMQSAEDKKTLNDGTYGGHASRSAYGPVQMCELESDIYCTSMKSGLIGDLDASACYDRNLICLASTASRQQGLHSQVALVNATTFEKARFRLKTTTGISKEFYKHSQVHPIFGTGQGSGNSPMLWLFVCSALFDAYSSKAHGAEFETHDRRHKMRLSMIGFVDDCTLLVNQFLMDSPPTVTYLSRAIESDFQLWRDLLWQSGGQLELPLPEEFPADAYPERYALLISSQSKIGWSHVFRGHFSTKWTRLQRTFLNQADQSPETCNGRNWTDSPGRFFIEQWFKVWELRNQSRHGIDQAAQAACRQAVLQTALSSIYEMKDKVLPRDRALFYTSVIEHTTRKPSLTSQENGIQQNTKSIKASAQAASEQNLGGTSEIIHWFTPVSETRPDD